MSVYSVKGKGWRYDFILKGQRYTSNWFSTKAAARQAEAKKRKEVKTGEVGTKKREEVTNPPADPRRPKLETTPTGMAFLELVNKWLDHVQAYKSGSYYHTCVVRARALGEMLGQAPVSPDHPGHGGALFVDQEKGLGLRGEQGHSLSQGDV